jgi:hypothetical protein
VKTERVLQPKPTVLADENEMISSTLPTSKYQIGGNGTREEATYIERMKKTN